VREGDDEKVGEAVPRDLRERLREYLGCQERDN
jgi:hypothetical protein